VLKILEKIMKQVKRKKERGGKAMLWSGDKLLLLWGDGKPLEVAEQGCDS
jgi:hypothetical protein